MFKSVVNIPAPESDHLRSQSSLAGAQLRSKRRRLDEGCEYNTSVIAVAALSAASVANSILNKNKKNKLTKNQSESISVTSPISIETSIENVSFKSGWNEAIKRLFKTAFEI